MRALGSCIVVTLSLAITVACGRSEEEIAAERAAAEAREAAVALKKAGVDGTALDGKSVEPVRFQDLEALLPEVSGWQRGEPRGERMTAPVPFSQIEADYTMGEANISIKLVDSAFSQLLIAPWAMFLTAGYERESTDGYEKSVSVRDNPGFERYTNSTREGELNLVLDKRFLLTIEGDNIDSTNVLHEFASKIEIDRLESVK